MAGELVTADNQYQIRDLLLGVGTKYRWDQPLPNWWGGATVRTNDTPYPAAHGVRGGRDLYGSKTVLGRLHVLGDNAIDLQSRFDDLAAAWAPSDEDLPFVAKVLGNKRRRYGRPRRLEAVTDHAIAGHMLTAALEFEALDPFVYSDTEHTVTIGVPAPGTGFTPPFTPPFTLGASSGGFASVVNAGSVSGSWTARLDGPLTNPAISLNGRILDLSANGGLILGASDFALLDARARSILLNGVADRRINLTLGSRWFDLDPSANPIGFAADAGTGSLTLSWRDVWI
jgi:hypothetical protein